ncbi:mechanosensitive ion channel family protein [Alteraurantiacibacter buctensis]|uniref:Mechanosensitive ion channel n=1 Tax=Alteraurantiacibacter buctensis TaxID=1503981 RepID=A0A844YX60_9SPHN|nr:mechanosensitive ion channel family protein [Alteraurantiacibacter buctensis]MXO70323.1 mechanosensitive ion channel [Alteraurantiacibacter buctensis]
MTLRPNLFGGQGQLEAVASAALYAAIAVVIAVIAHRVLFAIMERLARASEGQADDLLLAHLKRPARWALAALAIVLVARETPLVADVWQKVTGFVMPALLGWIALAIVRGFLEAGCLPAEGISEDDLRMRRKRTRLTIFSRLATFIIVFVTVGLMLLSIPGVRQIGVTLMASAGLATLAVGAAAQPALKSLIAGLQMALTEPIRIGDIVTIDGETGRVEDIRASYVVVRIWDQRRMIVPSARFLDVTFTSATRYGSEATGTVLLYVRPDADVAAIRAAFIDHVRAHPLWDGREARLQVTNSTIDTVELRLVMTAASPADGFTLRCDMREAMLAWLHRHMPLSHAPLSPAPLPPGQTEEPDSGLA